MKIKALVVDDSKIMRKIVMDSLNKTRLADFEFVEAEDGAVALSKFDPRNINILFIDWNMPNMNGIELVEKIRAMGKTEHVKIVMVTSEKTMGKVETALDKAGANEYICKPFTVEELQKKLSNLISDIAQTSQNSGGFFSKLLNKGA